MFPFHIQTLPSLRLRMAPPSRTMPTPIPAVQWLVVKQLPSGSTSLNNRSQGGRAIHTSLEGARRWEGKWALVVSEVGRPMWPARRRERRHASLTTPADSTGGPSASWRSASSYAPWNTAFMFKLLDNVLNDERWTCCNVKTRKTAAEKHLHGHIVVCVLACENSPRLCLVNFLMPLRTSNLLPGDLRPVVFVGQANYFSREWDTLANFPEVYILDVKTLFIINRRCIQYFYVYSVLYTGLAGLVLHGRALHSAARTCARSASTTRTTRWFCRQTIRSLGMHVWWTRTWWWPTWTSNQWPSTTWCERTVAEIDIYTSIYIYIYI